MALAAALTLGAADAQAQSFGPLVAAAFHSTLDRQCALTSDAGETELTAMELALREQADKAKAEAQAALREWRFNREELERLEELARSRSGQEPLMLNTMRDDTRSLRKKFLRALALSIAQEAVESLVGECIARRRDRLASGWAEPTEEAPFGTPPAEVCFSSSGPLGCAGSFTGEYDLDCSPASGDRGSGTLTLKGDGSVELIFQSQMRHGMDPPPMLGSVDASGNIRIERERGLVYELWEGSIRRRDVGEGKSTIVGRGRYVSKVSDERGDVYLNCIGTFVLGPP